LKESPKTTLVPGKPTTTLTRASYI